MPDESTSPYSALNRSKPLPFTPTKANSRWQSHRFRYPAARTPIFSALDLGDHVPSTDFVVFGPGGLQVIEGRTEAGQIGPTRTLHPVAAPPLADATKIALSMVALDVNDDGLIDLVVACQASNSAAATLRVLRNEGNRHFRDITARSGLSQIEVGAGSLTAVDWDNDLDVDLLMPGTAAPSQSPTAIAFFKGRGLARFRGQSFRVKDTEIQSATSLAVLDADSNGSWDLLTSNPHGMFLLLTSTTEHGRVETIGVEAISEFPFDHVLVFDYDNDGCPDLIAWNREAARCFHGSAEGHFEPADEVLPSALRSTAISSADFGDLDQNGDSDLVIVQSAPGNIGGRWRCCGMREATPTTGSTCGSPADPRAAPLQVITACRLLEWAPPCV